MRLRERERECTNDKIGGLICSNFSRMVVSAEESRKNLVDAGIVRFVQPKSRDQTQTVPRDTNPHRQQDSIYTTAVSLGSSLRTTKFLGECCATSS